MGSAATDRSIYKYDPLIPPEREVQARVKALVDERRGTYGQLRFASTYILTCTCEAVTVTADMEAPERFRKAHLACRPREEGATYCRHCGSKIFRHSVRGTWFTLEAAPVVPVRCAARPGEGRYEPCHEPDDERDN